MSSAWSRPVRSVSAPRRGGGQVEGAGETGVARYIGRVGALAVALGVGSVLAATPAALADNAGSEGSSGSAAAAGQSGATQPVRATDRSPGRAAQRRDVRPAPAVADGADTPRGAVRAGVVDRATLATRPTSGEAPPRWPPT